MITYVLNEEQQMLLDLVRDICKTQIRNMSEAIDHNAECPSGNIAILAESGLVACSVMEEYGGAGLSPWFQTAVIEEVAKECGSTALALANICETSDVISKFGSESQKSVILQQLTAGKLASVCGSDSPYGAPFSVTAKAELSGNEYLLTGIKKNVINSGKCSWYLVAADLEGTIRWFVVCGRDTKRIEKAPKIGFKGCRIADLDLNGVSGEILEGDIRDFVEPCQWLDMAAIGSGLASGAMSEAIPYLNQRIQFGKPVSRFENNGHRAADLLAKADAMRALVWSAADVKGSGEDFALAAALAKIFTADNATEIGRKVIQFMGGYGYSCEYPVERKYRDSKMVELLCGAVCDPKDYVSAAAVVID